MGADKWFRPGMFEVVSGMTFDADKDSASDSISPVQATTVWFQGVSSDER